MELEDLIIPITADSSGMQGDLQQIGLKIRKFGAQLTRAFGGIGDKLMESLLAADTTGEFAAAQEKLTASIDTAWTSLAATLLPIALQIVQGIQGLVDAFNNLSPEAKAVIAVVFGLVGTLGLLGPVIAAVGSAITVIGTIIGAISAPVLAVIALILGIIAAIGLAINAFHILAGVWDLTCIFFATVLGLLRDKVVAIWEGIKTTIKNAIDAIKAWIDSFIKKIIAGIEWLKKLTGWDTGDGAGNMGVGGTVPQQRASGGPVYAGQSYIVGEHRPELFTPSQNGTISPSVPGIDYDRMAEIILGAVRVGMQARPN